MKFTKNRVKSVFKYFGISVGIIVGGILIAGQITLYSIPEPGVPPGLMYTVNGGEIHMYCTGPQSSGNPTIIIVPGAGVPSILYSSLQEKLSETARTCSYDTAGVGWSKANQIPYTAENLSEELSQLLKVAQIKGPVILAGHSLGGIVNLIYSAEHEKQVVGIAFIDSSHYNQFDYFGEGYREFSEKQMRDTAGNLWLMELASNLGIMAIMERLNTTPTTEIEEKQLKMIASFNKENPPFPTIKSMISNLNLSFEQGKQAHYVRGDLPIVSISASDQIPGAPVEVGGVTSEDIREGFKRLHKDLAELSTSGKHVIVNGTTHASIINNDETASHILSLIHLIEERTKNES